MIQKAIILNNEKLGNGYLTLPAIYVKTLGWQKGDKLFITITNNDILIISKELPFNNENTKDIITTNLTVVKIKKHDSYRLSLSRDIINTLGFDITNKMVSIEHQDNNIIIKKYV